MPGVIDNLTDDLPAGTAEVIRLPAAQAADRVAARADEQPGLEEALRAALAAICEELDLVAARASIGERPPRVIWHVARSGSMRLLRQHVREPAARREGLDSIAADVAGAPAPVRIEGFAEPGNGRARELPSLCSSLG